MAAGIEETFQARFDGLALGQEALGVKDLVAAGFAGVALVALVQAEGQASAHPIQLVRPQAGVKDGRAHPLPIGQLHQLVGIGIRTPELFQTLVEGHPAQRVPVQVA